MRKLFFPIAISVFVLLSVTNAGASCTRPNRHALSGPAGACQFYNPSHTGRVVGSAEVTTNRKAAGQVNLSVDVRVPAMYYVVGVADLSYDDNGVITGCAVSWLPDDHYAAHNRLTVNGKLAPATGDWERQVVIMPTKSFFDSGVVVSPPFDLTVS